jgi:hypothetical protein
VASSPPSPTLAARSCATWGCMENRQAISMEINRLPPTRNRRIKIQIGQPTRSTRQSARSLTTGPSCGKENPRGDQRVGRGVRDHSITDSPGPQQHASIQKARHCARKPTIPVHDSKCDRRDEEGKEGELPKADRFKNSKRSVGAIGSPNRQVPRQSARLPQLLRSETRAMQL